MEDPWNLSQEERDAVVSRAAHGILSLCFFSQGESVSDEVALAAAQSAEKKAFSRAKVESQTTTGHRPRCARRFPSLREKAHTSWRAGRD